MIKINLLPVKAAKKKEKVIQQVVIGGLILMLALAGIGWRYATQKDRIKKTEIQIQEVDKKIEKLRDAKKKFEELMKKKETLERQLRAITNLDEGRDWFIRVLDHITESVPHNVVWVESIKFGAAGKGGGADLITIKGKSYDRDAVAMFMGNLSIIPCDDTLPDEEKADVCRQRDQSCRRWNEEKKNLEWDYEGCRQFYKNTCSQADSCESDLNSCTQNQNDSCQGAANSPACRTAKAKCEEMKKKCTQAGQDCKKLHKEEYILYNEIVLKGISNREKGGTSLYDFEVTVKQTSPR